MRRGQLRQQSTLPARLSPTPAKSGARTRQVGCKPRQAGSRHRTRVWCACDAVSIRRRCWASCRQVEPHQASSSCRRSALREQVHLMSKRPSAGIVRCARRDAIVLSGLQSARLPPKPRPTRNTHDCATLCGPHHRLDARSSVRQPRWCLIREPQKIWIRHFPSTQNDSFHKPKR